ncbi:ABC transporter permease (plasmid) [Tistrella mobilis]|uniref:ABC transporter permease n=1 Tax=Tistrella mobilis TaxID=171437 RepID=UPI003558E0B0
MRAFFSAFFRHPSGITGAVLLALVTGLALGAPLLFPVDPWEMVGAPFEPPLSEGLIFGSDTLGRDVAAGIAWGARVSLIIGIASAVSAAGIGVIIGAAAGYFGGLVDDVLMRITELFQTIPGFVLAILLVAILSPGMETVIFSIAVVSWPPLARLTRAEFMSLATRDFVHAARCQGESALAIIIRHILPNAASPIVVATSLTVATAILIESALSFLGLGDPNDMSWGFMVGSARTVIRQAWWTSVFPGLAILLTVVAVNLVGEALNDALNPRISRARSTQGGQ